MADDEPTTQELRAVQLDRKERERSAAREARNEDEQQAHDRRADKAAYLEEKLAEAERAEEQR